MTTYDDALLACREMSTDALLAAADALSFTVADPDPELPGEVGRILAAERLRAVRTELDRRERLHRIGRGVPSPADERYAGWQALARLVRERVEVPDVLRLAGFDVQPAGRNHRRGASEYGSSCPACGGGDRLRSWAGPNGRAWCRRCQWGGDVVLVAQSLLAGCASFRDAVRELARMAGAGVPR